MRILTVTIALCLATPALADTPTADEAGALMKAKDYEAAVAAYKALAKAQPEHAQTRYMLGLAYHLNGDYRKAIKAYDKALELGFYPIVTEYNLACVKALLGEPEAAFTHLEASLTAGYADPANMEKDPDLASIRDDARFPDLVTWADKNKRPCMHDVRLRGFDFWIGDWEVKDANGVTVGFNTVESAHEGCAVVENWRGILGMTGTSLNFYDPAAEEWVEVWVGSPGGKTTFRGNLDEAGNMVLVGQAIKTDGTTNEVRGTWTRTEEGVTQHFERWDPDAEAWTTQFKGFYTPKPEDETASAE